MALTYVAELPIPLLVPSVQLSIGVPAISFNASLTGALALNASLSITPPTISIYLSALLDLMVTLDLAISLSLPSVSFDLSASLSLTASLNLAFSLLIVLEGILTAAIGMYAYSYTGIGNELGASLTAELATEWPDGVPTTGTCYALIFGAATPVAITQVQKFLNGLNYGTGLVFKAKMSAMAQLSLVTAAAIGQGYAGISAQLQAALTIQAAAMVNVSVTPPTLAATATALLKFAANLEAQLSLAPPSISAALSATANLAASLSANFNFMISLGVALENYAAELFIYTYTGPADTLGAAVTSALGSTWGDGKTSTSGDCVATFLAATDVRDHDLVLRRGVT
jgi:hypothetical protein